MLVLHRTQNQKVFIDVPPSTEPTRIEVQVVDIMGIATRLGFTAPRAVSITRDDAIKQLAQAREVGAQL